MEPYLRTKKSSLQFQASDWSKFDLYTLAAKFATLDLNTLKELQESVIASNQSSAELQNSVLQQLSSNDSIANELPNFSDYITAPEVNLIL